MAINARKPVSFPQYHFLIIKDHSLWLFDSGTWDETEARQIERNAKDEYGQSNIKLCTSPSDDDQVITRIVRAYNHNKR